MRDITSKTLTGLLAIGLLAACSDSNNNSNNGPIVTNPPPAPVIATFQVSVTNLTNAQPLSPAAVIIHQTGFQVFDLGAPATNALEVLAEGGDNSDLLTLADNDVSVYSTASGNGPIPPGQNEVISFDLEERAIPDAYVSVATMLVNTNDAFTGASLIDLTAMSVGDSVTRRGRAYDAGTEADDELAIYIPGPAGGGEGYNAVRDDSVNAVTMHTGVVTSDDGLVTSALTGQHKFDNPVISIRIERIN